MNQSGGAWSAKGRFGPNDVHHQYAIVFQTPPFYNTAVERPVQVMIALRRPSDSELSEPKPFLYLPQEFGESEVAYMVPGKTCGIFFFTRNIILSVSNHICV